jgi:hypothetical protein
MNCSILVFNICLLGEVAAADKLSYQNGKPDFDLIEP